MKKIRIAILLALLALVGSMALINPKVLQDLVYQAVGKAFIEGMYGMARKAQQHQAGTQLDERMTPIDLYQRVQSRYQLRPDMRFIGAAAELYRFVAQADASTPQLVWEEQTWRITIGGQEAGALPLYPSFQQGVEFLENWAARLIADHAYFLSPAVSANSRVDAGSDGFNPSELIENLRQLNKRWQAAGRSGKDLHAAVNNLVRLSVINRDTIGLSDDHNARALAMLVLAQVINAGLDYDEQTSQLAYALGYHGDAQRYADSLPEDNLWKAFVRQDDLSLLKHLQKRGRINEARYLVLKRLALKGDAENWFAMLHRFYDKQVIPVHALMTGYDLVGAQAFLYVSHAIPLVIVEFAGGEPAWRRLADDILAHIPGLNKKSAKAISDVLKTMLRPGLKHRFKKFNQQLEVGQTRFDGAFINGASWARYQRSLFVGAIYKHGVFTLDRMIGGGSTEYLVEQLNAVDNEDASLLANYFEYILDARRNEASVSQGIDLISALGRYGAEPMFRVFEQVRDEFDFGSSDVAAIMTEIVDASDSRIEGRFSYAYNVRRYLYDLGKAHRVYESIIRDGAAHSQDAKAWVGYYYNDLETVIDVLNDPATTYESADYIVNRLDAAMLTPAQLDRVYHPILKKFAWSWPLRRLYLDALEQQQRYAESRDQAQDWLQTAADYANSYDKWRAHVYVGRSYRLQGDYDKALAAIQGTLRDGYGFGYYEATEIAISRGDTGKALDIAEMVRPRFPNSYHSLKNSLRAYWANHHFDKAAELIDNARTLGFYRWRYDIGDIFSEIFASDVEAGVAAFNVLTQTGIEHIRLAEVPLRASRNGLHELAFKTSNLLNAPGPGIFVYKLHAYRALKQWQGEQAALDWLNRLYPETGRNRLSIIIHYQQQFDLLWDFIPEPQLDVHPYGVWVIRAAADVLDGNRKPQNRERLLRYYNNATNNHYYDQLGRMVLGLESGDALLETEYGAKGLAEVCYYKGIQQYARGDYYAAADWFRAAIETRLRINGEYRWAYGTLETWAMRGTALEHQIASVK